MRRRERTTQRTSRKEKKWRKTEQIQIDRLVARSVIVILGGWMNVFDGHCRFREGECLKTREIGLGPWEKESMCEGHLSALLLFFLQGCGGCLKFEGSWK